MKVSKEQAARHREALIEAGSTLLKERGFDGASVADISEKAGLTQGAFYRHFASKDALAAEACRHACAENYSISLEMLGNPDTDMAAFIENYLSSEHLDAVAEGCPMAAYANEIRRQDKDIQAAFVSGFEQYAELLQRTMPESLDPKILKSRSQLIVAAMVGNLVIARALKATDPILSQEILQTAREELVALATS